MRIISIFLSTALCVSCTQGTVEWSDPSAVSGTGDPQAVSSSFGEETQKLPRSDKTIWSRQFLDVTYSAIPREIIVTENDDIFIAVNRKPRTGPYSWNAQLLALTSAGAPKVITAPMWSAGAYYFDALENKISSARLTPENKLVFIGIKSEFILSGGGPRPVLRTWVMDTGFNFREDIVPGSDSLPFSELSSLILPAAQAYEPGGLYTWILNPASANLPQPLLHFATNYNAIPVTSTSMEVSSIQSPSAIPIDIAVSPDRTRQLHCAMELSNGPSQRLSFYTMNPLTHRPLTSDAPGSPDTLCAVVAWEEAFQGFLVGGSKDIGGEAISCIDAFDMGGNLAFHLTSVPFLQEPTMGVVGDIAFDNSGGFLTAEIEKRSSSIYGITARVWIKRYNKLIVPGGSISFSRDTTFGDDGILSTSVFGSYPNSLPKITFKNGNIYVTGSTQTGENLAVEKIR